MKTVYMHRLILGLGADESVDHKDGDGLNNTRANLRPATHQQNLCNQILSAANTSGFKGVIRREQRNMTAWRAQIKFRGQNIFIGNYPTPEDAARAYDRKALELFGSFAKTNEQLGLLAA